MSSREADFIIVFQKFVIFGGIRNSDSNYINSRDPDFRNEFSQIIKGGLPPKNK